jgi:hypothetical protein
MLKLIDQFQKEASTFKLDPNSVDAFDTWMEFKAAAKTAGRSDDSVKEFNMFMEAKKTADEASDYISKKVEHLMKNEGKTQDQALGQAYGMAREKGYNVPEPPKKGSVDKKADEPEEMGDMEPPKEQGLLSPDEVDLENDEHGEDKNIEEMAAELFEKWEAGEMSLKEMHHNILEQLGDEEKEEEAEDILFGMVDAKLKDLMGEEEGEGEGEEGKEKEPKEEE